MARKPKKAPKIATRVRSALRRAWSFYGANSKEALNKARVGYGRYKCAECGKHIGPQALARDHILPAGSFGDDLSGLTEFSQRLFFGPIQILCKTPCHAAKTKRERAERKKAK